MQDQIRDVLAAHGRMAVDPREVDAKADLYELGLTSHASVDVMLALEDEFDIEFPEEVLKKSTFESDPQHRAGDRRPGQVGCLMPTAPASPVGELPCCRDDYGDHVITLPSDVDGRRVRVGCDVMAVEEVQDSLDAFGDRYLRKVFTDERNRRLPGPQPGTRLAARFAAKEAVIKAFAEPGMPFPLREIEVTRDGPLPVLRLSGTIAERATQRLAEFVFVAFARRLPCDGRCCGGLPSRGG